MHQGFQIRAGRKYYEKDGWKYLYIYMYFLYTWGVSRAIVPAASIRSGCLCSLRTMHFTQRTQVSFKTQFGQCFTALGWRCSCYATFPNDGISSLLNEIPADSVPTQRTTHTYTMNDENLLILLFYFSNTLLFWYE